MGLEIAGEILQVGEVAVQCSSWKAGDRVCALLGGGGYAEYAAVRYDMLMLVPRGLTMEEAAALAAWYSSGRTSGRVPIDYTRRRYVKKPGGAKPLPMPTLLPG